MRKEVFIGIDPGSKGSVCGVDRNGNFLFALKLSAMNTYEVVDYLEYVILGRRIVLACLEKVTAMPGRRKDGSRTRKIGAASAFKFGMSVGEMKGVLTALKIRWQHVTPSVWQRKLKCLSGGKKKVTREKARQLFPGELTDYLMKTKVKITDEIADGLLIAEYARLEAIRENLA